MLLALLLGCPAPPVAPETPTELPRVRVIAGPWQEGTHLSLAATGPRTLEGAWSGPTIVLAAWVQDGGLYFSSSLNGGRGWSLPVQVSDRVDISDDGSVGPDLALGDGRTLIAFSQDQQLQLAQRADYDWSVSPLGEGLTGQHLRMEAIDGDPILAWVQPGQGVAIWMNEEIVQLDADVGECARPGLGTRDEWPLLVWRDAAGATREATWRGSWELAEEAGPGALEGCPTDGPAVDLGEVLVADGRLLRAGQVLDSPEEGWVVSAPQGIGGVNLWVEQKDATRRIRVEETALLSREGPLILGDAVVVAGEIWVPFQTESAVVAAWAP